MASKLEIAESFFYSSGQIVLGLILHPYRTMQLIVRGKVFLPFVFLPLLILLLVFLLFRIDFVSSFYLVNWFFSFFVKILIIFLALWQITLSYLLIRFSRVLYR